jgi:hypothetical protein
LSNIGIEKQKTKNKILFITFKNINVAVLKNLRFFGPLKCVKNLRNLGAICWRFNMSSLPSRNNLLRNLGVIIYSKNEIISSNSKKKLDLLTE